MNTEQDMLERSRFEKILEEKAAKKREEERK